MRLYLILVLTFYITGASCFEWQLNTWHVFNKASTSEIHPMADLTKLESYPMNNNAAGNYQLDERIKNAWFQTTTPGLVHLDFLNAGLLPEYYSGNMDQSDFAKWLEVQDWIYTTTFDAEFDENESPENLQSLELVFEGLDTYAKIYINGNLVMETDNMFRTWRIPITPHLKSGTNLISVHFTSPLNYHRETVKNARYELPSGNETSDLKVSAYSRKAAYHFGWDWGPRYVTCGIWKPCYIREIPEFEITHFFAHTQSASEEKAEMEFSFELTSDQNHLQPLSIDFLGVLTPITAVQGSQKITLNRTIQKPDLWYPNGYGSHSIYLGNIRLLNAQKEVLLNREVTFAIRTIELINEKDSIGTSFYFKVNGKPIFIKGANYIPQDLFLTRVTNEKTGNLLRMVEDCGMNMIRVWGGGIYESDYFYDQCDRRGILVWQDFMFANSMYPADEKFHNTVEAEIEDNVKRLRNHPCIALWCGNNEIEVAWHNWGWQKQYNYSAKDSTEIWENYKSIFHKLIPEKLNQLDPSRSYIPSSPQSNWGKKENFNHGAMHYWGVWHGKEDTDSFKTNVGRFMVEYGFQSYPTADLLRQYIDANQFYLDSPELRNRQKSYVGNDLIAAEVGTYLDSLQDFSDWLWATQYAQGQALKKAIIAHRIAAPHCMGTLFWQLNDCWPGASWSVLDYKQTPKLSYLAVEKWFSPTIAILEKKDQILSLRVHSDKAISASVTLQVFTEEFGEPVKGFELDFELKALETKEIWTYPLKKILKKIPLEDLYIEVNVKNKGETIFYDFVNFRRPRIDEIY